MRVALLVAAYWACAGYARRVQRESRQTQSILTEEFHNAQKAEVKQSKIPENNIKRLPTLLPAAAFSPYRPGALSNLGNPSRPSARPAAVSTARASTLPFDYTRSRMPKLCADEKASDENDPEKEAAEVTTEEETPVTDEAEGAAPDEAEGAAPEGEGAAPEGEQTEEEEEEDPEEAAKKAAIAAEKKALQENIDAAEKQLVTMRKERNSWREKVNGAGEKGFELMAADFERFRIDSREELKKQAVYGRVNAMKSLLPFIERFAELQKNVENTEDPAAEIHKPYSLVYNKLKQLVDTWKLVQFEVPFNSTYDSYSHEAVGDWVISEDVPSRHVLEQVEAGWKMGAESMVVRKAKCTLSRGPPPKPVENATEANATDVDENAEAEEDSNDENAEAEEDSNEPEAENDSSEPEAEKDEDAPKDDA